MLVFCILYLVQNYTIGQFDMRFNHIKIEFIYLKEIIFLITSFILCKIALE